MATEPGAGSFIEHFGSLEDPRIDRTKRHELLDIVAITICAVICGADNWVEVEDFGKAKHPWLKTFLSLPNGIPSHDTFGRVFAMLSPDQFAQCFLNWVKAISQLTQGQVVAIDGKTLRRSHDKVNGKGALHMVSAWASENRLVLGQTRVSGHSNEITAIPQLLRLLELSGCIVTIDAMGCQKEIAQQIVEGGADYVLAVKANQGRLHENIQDAFDCAQRDGFGGAGYSYHEQVNKGHGRIETRRCWVLTDPEQLRYVDPDREWKGLKRLGMVRYERVGDDQANRENRYYISSLTGEAPKLLQTVRGHWGIENSLHWVMDMVFRDDECRIRTDHAPANFTTIKHMALNLTRRAPGQDSLRLRRKVAAWDEDYLASLITV
jgi:predicted transposase YbfD/YdcC